MKSSTTQYDLAHVVWLDPSGRQKWQDLEEAKRAEPITCECVGWVIKNDKKCLTLASSVSLDPDGRSISEVGDRTTLPKNNILRIIVLRKRK